MAMDREDEVGALWLKESQAGKKYMSGKLKLPDGDVDVVVFKNDRKQPGEKTPDYRIYRSQPREGGSGPTSRFAQSAEPARTARPVAEELDDGIPF